MSRTIAIIPARGGSKRLPRKNVTPIAGKPLLWWTIEAAAGSDFLSIADVFVSTEDEEIAQLAREAGAGVVSRPLELAGDNVWTQPVIEHAVDWVESQGGERVDTVLWMNVCLPEITPADVNQAFTLFNAGNLREVVAVGLDGKSNSGIRVLRREALDPMARSLSINFQTLALPYLDIHFAEDIPLVEHRLLAREKAAATPVVWPDRDWELDPKDWSTDAFMSKRDVNVMKTLLERKAAQLPPGQPLEVLEWGSGQSTLFFTRFLREKGIPFRWLSLEYDRGYFQSALAQPLAELADAGTYLVGGAELPALKDAGETVQVCVFDYGQLYPFRRAHRQDGQVSMEDYIALPGKTGRKFDLVLVDGRKRRRCTEEAAGLLAPDGVCLLHDAWRPYYHRAFSRYLAQSWAGDIFWAGSQSSQAYLMAVVGPHP